MRGTWAEEQVRLEGVEGGAMGRSGEGVLGGVNSTCKNSETRPCLACCRNRERSPGGRSRVREVEREEVRAGRG